MPICIPPFTRRKFITSTAIFSAGYLFGFKVNLFSSENNVDPDYFVLLADTHIDSDPNYVESRWVGSENVAENLSIVVNRIISNKSRRPGAVIINGDAARIQGLRGDYRTLVELLEPIRKAEIPIFITMGNHDNRQLFHAVIPGMKSDEPFVSNKHIVMLETPSVYLFMLDTLRYVNETPGTLGEQQLEWLDKALLQYNDKPVITFGHHNPDTGTGGGLLDVNKFYDIVLPKKHVKVYLFGHTHIWQIDNYQGLRLINLPATSYVFRSGQPTAFVHSDFKSDRVLLRLDTIDKEHPANGLEHEIMYRDDDITSIEKQQGEPNTFLLHQNYPNPFNNSTVIRYQLPVSTKVRLEVFDVKGKSMNVLVDGFKAAGHHDVTFTANGLASGLYFYRILTGEYIQINKMSLIR